MPALPFTPPDLSHTPHRIRTTFPIPDLSSIPHRRDITFPDLSKTPHRLLARAAELLPRRPDGGYYKPQSFSPGVLFVFALLGASLALLCWWLFIRRSGFIWKKSDWQDYKASVLRRPDLRPDDAITVFSDGSTRRHGGGGSSCGARTVVLGELGTTYSKSMVVRNEKPWLKKEKHAKGGGSVLGSVWGRIRGGDRSDTDTEIAREKELAEETETEVTFVDKQRPAPPLSGLTSGVSETTRATSYTEAESDEYSDSETDSDSDESDEESEFDVSDIGMSKGNKVYHHSIFNGRRGAVEERNGAAMAGAYGVGPLQVRGERAVARGYRASSVGSLSSEGSVASSRNGR